tara:strand:+ start:865 stop:1722 length:858 start_codon:yes stop_codon:yes gene_type:complete
MIEGLRRNAVLSLHKMGTFSACWPIWRSEIAARTSDLRDPTAIYDLGEQLSQIFALTSSGGRDQGALSGGGAAWEALVCWYLNVVMIGSRAVVIKQNRSLIPDAFLSAMTVVYGNFPTNTESDLSGIVFPDNFPLHSGQFDSEKLQDYVAGNINEFSLHNIQCKTNWNDNAQIPMLWDMIYSFRGAKNRNVHIGHDGFDLDDLREFTYSFVTVPSQKKAIKANSMAVQRVRGLSGGNYWGKPTDPHVALGLPSIFKRVFKAGFDGDIKSHVAKQIQNGAISYLEP